MVLVIVLEIARKLSGPPGPESEMTSMGIVPVLYGISFLLFVIAAGTDWLDGYYARKYGLETTLGRILDPFADKMIICGTFTLLLSHPLTVRGPFGLAPWMVVVLIARELLITVIRGYVEGQGVNFGAKWIGKWKMGLQCIAAGGFLFCLAFGAMGMIGVHENGTLWVRVDSLPLWGMRELLIFAWWFTVVSLWGAIVLTIWSAWTYIVAAIRISRDIIPTAPDRVVPGTPGDRTPEEQTIPGGSRSARTQNEADKPPK